MSLAGASTPAAKSCDTLPRSRRGGPRQLGRGLGATATGGGGGVGEHHELHGTVGRGGVIGGGSRPGRVGVQLFDESTVVRQHKLPRFNGGGHGITAGERGDDRIDRSDSVDDALHAAAAPPKSRPTSTRWHAMDRASSAPASDAAIPSRSLTTAHDLTFSDGVLGAPTSSKIGPNLGLLAPLVA